jgi:hypothetical protein
MPAADSRPGRLDKDSLARKAFQNTKLYFQRETATFTVQLYATEVVTIHDKEGTATLNTSGYKTLETLEVINQALQPFSYKVNEGWGRRWEVVGNGVPPQPFEDGMKIHEIARWPMSAKQCERRLQPLIDAAGPPPGRKPRQGYRDRSRSRSRGRENGRSYGGRKDQRMQVDDEEEVTDFQ